MDNQVCEAIWFSVVFIVISSSIRRGYWFAYNKQSQDLQHNINLLSDGPQKKISPKLKYQSELGRAILPSKTFKN
jgi:hypothetical protein